MSNYFVTSAGRQIEVQSVPMLLLEDVRLKAMQTVQVPPIPTYQVELADGTFVPYAHDEKSIADDKTSEAERQAWKAYKEALAHQSTVSANKVMELFLAKGVILSEELSAVGEWAELQQYFGIELPTHPIPLKIHYLKTEVLTNPNDINGLISKIMESSGIDPNLLAAARASFRSDVWQEGNSVGGAGGIHQPALEGKVENQQEVPGTGSS